MVLFDCCVVLVIAAVCVGCVIGLWFLGWGFVWVFSLFLSWWLVVWTCVFVSFVYFVIIGC